jgi:uncharacterized protein
MDPEHHLRVREATWLQSVTFDTDQIWRSRLRVWTRRAWNRRPRNQVAPNDRQKGKYRIHSPNIIPFPAPRCWMSYKPHKKEASREGDSETGFRVVEWFANSPTRCFAARIDSKIVLFHDLRRSGVRVMGFEWDFDDPYAITIVDDESDPSEQPFITLGMGAAGRLPVAYTWRGANIRILSARSAENHERDEYEADR